MVITILLSIVPKSLVIYEVVNTERILLSFPPFIRKK